MGTARCRSLSDVSHRGSPPHAWGQRPLDSVATTCMSVHPHTRGDSGLWRLASASESAVHPHTRGDSARLCACKSLHCGSPPHAWGQRPGAMRLSSRLAVHPHTRGDSDVHSRRSRRLYDGSPPHAWGQRVGCGTGGRRRSRFTPTRVGTASSRMVRSPSSGSPPHAWGQRSWRQLAERRTGSPPHAWGQRASPSQSAGRLAVHPHTRGDSRTGVDEPRRHARFTPTRVGTAFALRILSCCG